MADDIAIDPAPVSTKERTDAQIAVDLAPLTADEQLAAAQLKVAVFDALASGKFLAPPVDKYDAGVREQVHDMIVVLTQRLEHVEDQLRHFTVAIQPRPGDPLPPDEPLKEPDPLGPREQTIQDLVEGGMPLDGAIAQVDAKGGA